MSAFDLVHSQDENKVGHEDDYDSVDWDEYEREHKALVDNSFKRFNEMTETKKKIVKKTKKPILIKVGKHLINPLDVSGVTEVRKNLYIVKFFSEPSPRYACWVEGKDIGRLLEHFEIVE